MPSDKQHLTNIKGMLTSESWWKATLPHPQASASPNPMPGQLCLGMAIAKEINSTKIVTRQRIMRKIAAHIEGFTANDDIGKVVNFNDAYYTRLADVHAVLDKAIAKG